MLLSINHPQNHSHGKGGIEPVLASCANHLEESCRINETIEKRALNESADQIRVLWAYSKGRCLGDAWLISSVIDIVQAEAAAVAIGPLKVVKKRPHKISCEKERGEELEVHDQTQQHVNTRYDGTEISEWFKLNPPLRLAPLSKAVFIDVT